MPFSSPLRQAYNLYSKEGLSALSVGAILFAINKFRYAGEVASHYVKMLKHVVEFRGNAEVTLNECLTIVRSGFKPEYFKILDLDSRDVSKYKSRNSGRYIGWYHPGPIMNVNENARHVLHDKFAVYRIFDTIDEYFPALYGTIHDGLYFSWDDGTSQSLREAVEVYGVIAAKPIDNSQGEGFYKLSYDGDFFINGEMVDAESVDRLQRGLDFRNYMVTEYLHQHSYSNTIAPMTTNTIRLFTVMDPETGEPRVARPIHRFGTASSAPVDNFDNGGVVAPIDLESGELKPLVVLDEGGNPRRMDTHPETDARVTGVEIPMWEEAKDVALDGARSYPVARIIGWDFVITQSGPMVLEASGQPGPILPQIEGGLLEDDDLTELFEIAEQDPSRRIS